jgi:hypothetical protein
VSSSKLVRLGGGLASATAGVLLLLGHVLDLGRDPEFGMVVGGSLVLLAHVARPSGAVFWAAWGGCSRRDGYDTRLRGGSGRDRRASGAEADAVLGIGLPGALALLGGLSFLIGRILFGAATMRANVFPRSAGLLLIVGNVIFAAASFAGPVAVIFEILGALITCAAFVWLGLSPLSGSGTSTGNPST